MEKFSFRRIIKLSNGAQFHQQNAVNNCNSSVYVPDLDGNPILSHFTELVTIQFTLADVGESKETILVANFTLKNVFFK